MTKNKKTNKRQAASRGTSNKRNMQNGMAQSLIHRPPVIRFTPRVFGFPDRLLTSLKYTDTGVIQATTGAVGLQIFRANSIFDFDYTNVGHQPMYRDTYAAIYDQYAVVSATFKLHLMNIDTAKIITAGVVIDDDTTVSTNAQILLEQNHGINDTLTPLSGSKSEWTVTVPWSCQEVLNIDPFASETYKTQIGSNPTETSVLAIWAAAEDAASTVYLHWKLDAVFEVLFTELATPSLS
jgi:hypothetical protein